MRVPALLLLFVVLAACGPSQRPDYVQEEVTDEARTDLGNLVRFGSSLRDHPEWRAEAVAAIESEEASHPSPRYLGTIFYVEHSSIDLGGAVETPFGGRTGSTTSYTDAQRNTVFLSWWLSAGKFQVGNVRYELQNVRCQCESALQQSRENEP